MNHDKSVWDIGDVAKKPDEEKQKAAEFKYCPMNFAASGCCLGFNCIGERCAWWVQNNTWRSDSGCAIRVIAERLRLK